MLGCLLFEKFKKFNEYCSLSKAATISYKIFETNSSFHVKYRTTRKVGSLYFGSLLLVLTKCFFCQGGGALGYHSMKFIHFPNIS